MGLKVQTIIIRTRNGLARYIGPPQLRWGEEFTGIDVYPEIEITSEEFFQKLQSGEFK